MYNIILELDYKDICNIATDAINLMAEKKIAAVPSLKDCLKTQLHRLGIMSWLAQNVQGGYQLYFMLDADAINYYDTGNNQCSKPWYKGNNAYNYSVPANCPFADSIPVLFRFEDSADAMFFKMTYVENS